MPWLEVIEKFAPLTVVTAIILFVAKEISEAIRRSRGRARKAKAIRILLVEELELNKGAIKTLRNILKGIVSQSEFDFETNTKSEFYLRRDASGGIHYRCRRSDGGDSWSEIPNIHRKHFDAFLPEIAEVDRVLFEKARKGYERIGELEHLRNSLIARLDENDPDECFPLHGFASWGLGVLDDVEKQMSAFYVFCSGRPFVKARIR